MLYFTISSFGEAQAVPGTVRISKLNAIERPERPTNERQGKWVTAVMIYCWCRGRTLLVQQKDS